MGLQNVRFQLLKVVKILYYKGNLSVNLFYVENLTSFFKEA